MTILREKRDHVEIITINRPEARNAIDGPTSTAIGSALDEIEEDKDIWVVIITGAGDKAFCGFFIFKIFNQF